MAANQPTLSDVEQWLPVVGYEGYYEVSNRGRVKSLPRVVQRKNGHPMTVQGRMLKAGTGPFGHLSVHLRRKGEGRTYQVHRLVLDAFVGPRPEGMEACHWNDIPHDNRLENLRWGTSKDNEADKRRNGGNYFLNKTHCPHGHSLAEPNLVAGRWKKGRRNCLACNRTRARVQRNPHLKPEFQRVSDSYYEQIMSDAA